jgi:hypothetical protein
LKTQQYSVKQVGTMLGLPDDDNFPAELERVAHSSDVGIGPLCARFLSLIDTDDFPVPLPGGAKLHEMFVVVRSSIDFPMVGLLFVDFQWTFVGVCAKAERLWVTGDEVPRDLRHFTTTTHL